MSPAAGEIVLSGRYRLVEPLASGGMGTVWRAYDDVLDRPVAVKEVLLPPGLDAEAREMLRRRTMREARAAAKLRHSAIVTIFDVVEQDDRPWIVMELVPSESLDQRLRRGGPILPSEAAGIGLRILDALVTAQAAGVQHRDIKPANVLLADDGRVVLTDFGIARHTGDETLTSAGLLVGSPNFLAPERARGLPSPGLQSDLWSLGALLYAAVEGQPPFERNGPLPTLAAVVMDEPPPPKRAGPLRPVIDGLLVKDPVHRLDADRTRAMLQTVLRPGRAVFPPVAASPAAVPPAPPDPTRPLPRMGAAGAAAPGGTAIAPDEAPAPETPPADATPVKTPPTDAAAETPAATRSEESDESPAGRPPPAADDVSAAGLAGGVQAPPPDASTSAGTAGGRPAPQAVEPTPPAADDISAAGTVGGAQAPVPAASTSAGTAGNRPPPLAPADPTPPATDDSDRAELASASPALPADAEATTADASRSPAAPAAAGPSSTPLAKPDTASRPADRRPPPVVPIRPADKRRTARLLAAAAAVAVILAAVLLPQVLDSPDQAAPAPTATSSLPGTAAPTDQGAASATANPSATAPSTPPTEPTTSAPAAPTVPAGFSRYTDPDGRFQVAIPAGWTSGPGRYPAQVRFNDPNSARYLMIETTNDVKADPYTNWVENERSYRQGKSDYQNLGIRRVSYGADKGWTCADWEFRIGGTHVLNRNVRVSSRRAHAIYWSTPESLWNTAESRRIFQVATATFVPAPVG